MKQFTERTFSIPTLVGISQKSVDEHLKLYSGYVKHANLILDRIASLNGADEHAYAIAEMQRRFGFEFDGVRNHEIYFSQFEGGAKPLADGATLRSALAEEFGSFDAWLARFKTVALTRGIGWAFLYHDPVTGRLLNAFVEEQHIGHLTGLTPILALDVWEHSYVADYQPSGKKQYVEDFFTNLNWEVVEATYAASSK